MGDVFLNMVRNVRIFGFSCWLKICVVIIMGLCIFMATKTDAQRFRKERNVSFNLFYFYAVVTLYGVGQSV